MIRAVLLDMGETLVEEVSDAERPLSQIGVTPFPYTVAALTRLKQAGYRLGIVSNTSNTDVHDMERALENAGLRPFFDAIVTSYESGHEKPDPAIFADALDKLGCSPDEAVMVGDDTLRDVVGAARLGLRVILVRTGRKSTAACDVVPTFTVDSLAEVPPLLEALSSGRRPEAW